MTFIKKYFLVLTIVPLLLLAMAACFYRFIVLADFTAEYQVACDPTINSCFIGCDDDDCQETYYYSIITRDANVLQSMCGRDITDCEASYSCTEGESSCEEFFCNADESECSTLTDSDGENLETNLNTYDL